MQKALAQGDAYPNNGGGMIDGAYPDQPEDLVECPTCGRRMTPKALQAHSKACGKTRKVFDMKKQRIDGEAKKALTDAKREERRSGRSKVRASHPSRARQPILLHDVY